MKKIYPTPRAQKVQSLSPSIAKRNKGNLEEVRSREIYPTPKAGRESGCLVAGSGHMEMMQELQDRGVITEEENKLMSRGWDGGELNSDWVCWLMGWPIGHVSLAPLPKENFDAWLKGMKDGTYWNEDPAVSGKIPRIIKGIHHREEQLKALGNGQVSACVAKAFDLLSRKIKTIKDLF